MSIIEIPQRLREKVYERLPKARAAGAVTVIAEVILKDHSVYLSTACLHGLHDYCNVSVRADGTPKAPGQCKFCPSKCVCDCHI